MGVAKIAPRQTTATSTVKPLNQPSAALRLGTGGFSRTRRAPASGTRTSRRRPLRPLFMPELCPESRAERLALRPPRALLPQTRAYDDPDCIAPPRIHRQ